MPYRADSFSASLVWGRIGAGLLGIVAFILGVFGYTMSPEDQASLETLIAGVIAGIGGGLALFSKIRESKKLKE